MKQKSPILLLFGLVFLLLGCRADEVINPEQEIKDEYTNKSLWKEDEKYIKNVKAVFDKYADKDYYYQKAGVVLWDYALTMGRFDESYLQVPVVKNNKVVAVLLAIRDGDRVFFKRKETESSKAFFEYLIFKDRKRLEGREQRHFGGGKPGEIAEQGLTCYTRTVVFTWEDGSKTSQTETHCVYIPDTNRCDSIYEDGGCGAYPYPGKGSGGGRGGGGGYSPPNPPTDPCEKMKGKFEDPIFKKNFERLQKKETLDLDHELGFAESYENSTPTLLTNRTGTTSVRLPEDGRSYYGFMHTHNNKEGVVRIFSPADVATFLSSCVRNAEEKGNASDAYAIVVTSEGSYTLKYTGDGNYSLGLNQLSQWNKNYYESYSYLYEESNGNFSQPDVERLFTRFLKEVVRIEGLEVYKSTPTSSEKMEYNGENQPVKTTPCN
ncbi:hypothetical protein JSO54_00170 [Riemerella anatipestifer]|uniref:hypothetical protein n=1 Tax=Riemerella anatipestifer TaxID=34085 RepID=UPI0030C196F9